MYEFRRWLIGFTCSIALLKYNSYFVCAQCPYANLNGIGKAALCNNTELSIIPTNLETDIVLLNLSKISISSFELENSTFEKYTSLIWLYMDSFIVNCDPSKQYCGHKASESAFLPLKNLQHFSMIESWFGEESGKLNFQWPPNIKTLRVDFPHYDLLLNVSHLNLIEELGMTHFTPELDDLPELASHAPLRSLYIDKNPMRQLTPERISQYCLLENVVLTMERKGPLVSLEIYCQCTRLENWLKEIGLVANFYAWCGVAANLSGCTDNFIDAYVHHYDCLQMHGKLWPWSKLPFWLQILLAVLLVMLFCSLIILTILYFIRRGDEDDDEEDDDG